MPVYRLGPELRFPPADAGGPEGLVAIGGDFRPERLILAYASGIFPWPARGAELLWFSPDPRFVLVPERVHVSRSLARTIRRGRFEVRADTAFDRVIAGCATVRRPGQQGTWISTSLRLGFLELHRAGLAHSVEAWSRGRLVGGLYGLSLGRVFFGESMFSLEPDASKVAFVTLVGNLLHWGFSLVDCQVPTEHLARFGAEPWPRPRFLQALGQALAAPTRSGPWTLPLDPLAALRLLSEMHRTAGNESSSDAAPGAPHRGARRS
ncbi:MAG: leucyl/phenylalanyl-tRNA--protein transferase [Myxococcota bacterium]|nr:leucyl/phenylalanyl-tRNA--protein transferase [Myxococcota bacterium]